MTPIVDLVTPSQEAMFEALTTGVDPAVAKVFVVVPQDTQPNFVVVADIDNTQDLDIEEQFELVTVEVHYVYRGEDRRVLTRMMHAGRAAIDQKSLPAQAGVAFGIPRFVTGAVSSAGPDGVTYAGIQTFHFHAQPAD